jgi:hypothetical protein
MKLRITILSTLLTVLAAGPLFAGEIYKWTDAEGNVHFGDKPDGARSERVAIVSRPTDRAMVQSQNFACREARDAAAKEKAEAAADAPSEDELQTAAAEKNQKCAEYRQKMQKLVQSRRLYREDEAGERVYLDEAQTISARAEVEGQISEYCGR